MKKPLDEMERNIKLLSQSYGFHVAIFIMVGWTLYESYLVLFTSAQKPNIIPCIILTVLNLLQYFFEMVLKRKMIAGDTEYKEPDIIIKVIITVAIISVTLASVVAFVLIHRR